MVTNNTNCIKGSIKIIIGSQTMITTNQWLPIVTNISNKDKRNLNKIIIIKTVILYKADQAIGYQLSMVTIYKWSSKK